MKISDKGLKVLSISREPEYNKELDSYLIYQWKGLEYYAGLTEPNGLLENQIFIEVSEDQYMSISKEDTYASQISNIKDLQGKIDEINASQPTAPPAAPPIAKSPAAPKKASSPPSEPQAKEDNEPVKQAVMVSDSSTEPSNEAPEENSQITQTKGTSNLSILSRITEKYSTALLVVYNQDKNSLLLEDIVGEVKPKEGFEISLKHASPFRIALQTQKPFHGVYSQSDIIDQSLIRCGINPQNLWITAYPLVDNGQVIGMLLGLSNNQEYKVDGLSIFEELNPLAGNMLLQSMNKAA